MTPSDNLPDLPSLMSLLAFLAPMACVVLPFHPLLTFAYGFAMVVFRITVIYFDNPDDRYPFSAVCIGTLLLVIEHMRTPSEPTRSAAFFWAVADVSLAAAVYHVSWQNQRFKASG